jgi:hypothetical protein
MTFTPKEWPAVSPKEEPPEASAAPTIHAAGRKKRRDGQKHVRLPEAFRERGLDERNLAGQFAGVMRKLRGQEGNPKSHLDGLKEWIRVLAEKAGGADDTPMMFQLIHSIPRPVREKPAAPPNAADDKENSEN